LIINNRKNAGNTSLIIFISTFLSEIKTVDEERKDLGQ
jgi:hypothetical protein